MKVQKFSVSDAELVKSPGQDADILVGNLIDQRHGGPVTIGYGSYAAGQTLTETMAVSIISLAERVSNIDRAMVAISRSFRAMPKHLDKIDILAGSRIRIRRRMLGMTQTELGRSLGITFQQVQKYENGTNKVSASRLQAIAHTLQMSVSDFFDETAAAETRNDELSRFIVTHEAVTLNVAFLQIKDQAVRRRVIALIEAASGT